jgi:5'-nucleotidase
MTKFRTEDGKRCDTCHGIMDHSSLVPDAFRQRTDALRDKYYPIEIDPSMTPEEKIPHMVEWYEKSHDVLAQFRFSKAEIRDMVQMSRAILRDGVGDALANLYNAGVPVLIFSAGIGQLLEYVLERDALRFQNLKIISNYMEYDEHERVKAFKPPLIHMFNKNENMVKHFYLEDLRHRKNALVLGDSLGDVQMSHGMPSNGSQSAILKIGFLNDKVDERLEEFMNHFDIVLVDDQTFDLVNLILGAILKSSPVIPN